MGINKMKNKNFEKKRLIASILSALMFSNMVMPLTSFASDISGVPQVGNSFHIEAEKVSGDTGFRHYDKFTLTNGDIANLIYKDNYTKFVNLVNNKVNIDGIVNTMKNGAFYNGHAIFVSPNGIAIGASGVLNVGSLSLITPSQNSYNKFYNAYTADSLSDYEYNKDNYNSLISDSQGDIVVNGRILAREEVNMYGKNIAIEGTSSNDKNAIITGWTDKTTVFNDLDAAKLTFNKLVSNNITDANTFNLEKGKIKIVSKANDDLADEQGVAAASVKINNSNLKGGDIDISANTQMESVYFDIGSANVDIENSDIQAKDVKIKAETESKTSQNINLVPPVVYAWIFENAVKDEDGNIISMPSVADYFSLSKPYTGFAGNRALANVNIKNSIVNATDNLNIGTKAVADFEANSSKVSAGAIISELIYAFGTKTQSKINISDKSKLTAGNNLNLDAYSENKLKTEYYNDNAILKLELQNAYNFAIFNTSMIADTGINISQSDLKADNINANSLAYSNEYLIANSGVTIGKNTFAGQTKGGSGATVLVNINNIDVNSNVNIEQSNITSDNDTNINAQSVNLSEKYVTSATKAEGYEKPKEYDVSKFTDILKKRFNTCKDAGLKIYKFHAISPQNIKEIYTLFSQKSEENVQKNVNNATNQKFDKAMFQVGGTVILENIEHNTNVAIDNSKIKAKTLNSNTLTFDRMLNSSTAHSTSGEEESANMGAGIAVIVSNRKNDSIVEVKNKSEINVENLNINSLNQLPGNHGTIGLSNSFLTLGVQFNGDAQDNWDIEFHNVTEPEGLSIMPAYGLFGLFNNYAAAATTGDKFAISASVVYNNIENTAKSIIDNSIVNATNDININSVNSVVARDASGFFGSDSVLNITDVMQQVFRTNGTGGAVLVQEINNDAISSIVNGSTVRTNGDLNLNSASEQSYMNIGTNGAKANQIAINGAVNVQNITGSTISQITSNSQVSGKNINVNAGKAKAALVKLDSTDKPTITYKEKTNQENTDDENTLTNLHILELDNIRDANDHVTDIGITGTLTAQKQDKPGEAMTASTALGASVNAQKIDRTIKAVVDNAILTSTEDTNIKSSTDTKGIIFALSGSYAGGQNVGDGNAQGLQTVAGADTIINEAQGEDHNQVLNNPNPNPNPISNINPNPNPDPDPNPNPDPNPGTGTEPVENPSTDIASLDENAQGAVNQAQDIVAQKSTFSIAAAGAVNSFVDSTKTESTVSGSTLNVGNNLNVTSNQDSLSINGAGGVAVSGKIGAGAGVNLYKQNGYVKALIKDSSTINFTGTNNSTANVSAINTNNIYNIAAGVGIAGDKDKGINAAVGGSFVNNTIKPVIQAAIEGSTINGNKAQPDLTVLAKSDVDILDIVGGAVLTKGNSNMSIGASIASTFNSFKNDINATVKDSVLQDIKGLNVEAKNINDVMSIGVAGALAFANSGYSYDGTVNVDYFHNNIKAQILNSDISASNNVIANAISDVTNRIYEGVLQVSGAQKGLGINGAVSVNVHDNDILAQIDSGNKKITAKNISTGAKSTEYSNVIPVTAAISKAESMVAANVGVNVINNAVHSFVSGNIDAKGNITVAADDETTLYTRGGTLEIAGPNASAVIGGAVNVDVITKDVQAKIGNKSSQSNVFADGTVAVSAVSTNSLGGTKNSSGNYDRDDITSKNYQDNLMTKDDKGHYSGIDYSNNFGNWNMFYNLSAGANAAVAGTVIVKSIENNVTAEILNSNVKANNVNISANDYSVKNIISGQIEASKQAAAGVQVLVTNDNSNTSALISNGSVLTVNDKLNILAINQKDNNQIVVAASGAGKGQANVNVLHNTISDKNTAKIENSTIEAANLNMAADEDINASRVIVAAGGAGNAALNVSPVINSYSGVTTTKIENSSVDNAAITMNADNNIKTRDISVGLSIAAKGVAGTGLAIKNTYAQTVDSKIEKSNINTSSDIILNANSVVNSNNWIVGVSGVGIGASMIVNVILNNMTSDVNTIISDSKIENAGKISLNSNKDKKDNLSNYTIAAGLSGEGASAVTNTIYNIYDNDVTSKINNTSVNDSASIDVQAFSNRDIYNLNTGVSIAGIGASMVANAIVNNINSNTLAILNAQSETINTSGKLTVKADDYNSVDNTIGMGNLAGLGGAVGANINLYYSDNLVKAEILSNNNGQINAGNAEISSNLTHALKNENVGVSLGFGSVAGDVAVIRLGKGNSIYNDSEKASKINEAVKATTETYNTVTTDSERNYNPETVISAETGSISNINANISTNNDIDVNATSTLKGLDSDTLQIDNINVNAGVAAVGVGVKSVDISNNTTAAISGGNVTSKKGNINLNAKQTNKVNMEAVDVNIAGLTVGGASNTYKNNSQTSAQISNANIKGKNVNLTSTSTNKANVTNSGVSVSGATVQVAIADVNDSNTSSAIITGNTNIDAAENLNIHATANSDMYAKSKIVSVSAANFTTYLKNSVEENAITKALIDNVTGEFNVGGLNITTDYDVMKAETAANLVTVGLLGFANIGKTGSNMDAAFTSGIDSSSGLVINNSGKTTITTAKSLNSNSIAVKSEIDNTNITIAQTGYTGTKANAINNAVSKTLLKAKEHNANSLQITSDLNTIANSDAGAVAITLLAGVSDVDAFAKSTGNLIIDIGGKNTIADSAVINAINNNKNNVNLSAINGGLVGVQSIDLNSEINTNSNVTIAGEYNANSSNVSVTNERESILNLSSGSGGVVNVSESHGSNILNGNSTVTIDGVKSTSSKINSFSLTNKSTNTHDTVSSDGSGGFISVSNTNMTSDFNTSTTTNIKNSDITSQGKLSYNVENENIVKDSASLKDGGFVALASNTASHTYSSNAKLNLENSNLTATDIVLQASSSIKNAKENNDSYVTYAGGAGGFVASNKLELTNDITQNSEIALKNSKLKATNNVDISAKTESMFKQKVDTAASGFVAIPKSQSWLNTYNTNKLTIDNNSKILAENIAKVSFDSNNDLAVHTASEAHHFGFNEPMAESYLTLVVNNTVENEGSIQAGNLVDINFMNNSVNNLTQYASTECYAAVAKSSEDGSITKQINNELNIAAGADITSNKNIDISYSSGSGTNNSTIKWNCVSYLLFGIPITNSDSKSSINIKDNYSLVLDGDMLAGQGNNKYMKINRDGSIDLSTKGFLSHDYVLYDGVQLDGQAIKDKTIASITIDIQNTKSDLTGIEETIKTTSETIDNLEAKSAENQQKLDEINTLIENGYVLKSDKDVNIAMANDLKAKLVDSGISEETITEILTDYETRIKEISESNANKTSDFETIPSITDYLDANDYSLTADQKTAIINNYNSVNANITETENGKFVVYNNGTDKYIVAADITEDGKSCKALDNLNDYKTNIDNRLEYYNTQKATAEKTKNALVENSKRLDDKLKEVQAKDAQEFVKSNEPYAVVFNTISADDANVNISGINNSKITGSGNIKIETPGLRIDNESTRSLKFNGIDFASNVVSGLTINGKNYAQFMDKSQAINGDNAYSYMYKNTPEFDKIGTTGVHLSKGENSSIVGITINNTYDTSNPFILDSPNAKTDSDITFAGIVRTNEDFNVFNDSGSISLNDTVVSGNTSLVSTKGDVSITSKKLTLKKDDKIFAGNSVNIKSDSVDIKGNITAGYENRSLTITDSMLSNLILDPTTGEKNMIDIGSNNNIKAIYKDNNIYLFNINNEKTGINSENRGKVTINSPSSSVTGTITMYDGYQNIAIDNQTNKQLNVSNIVNRKSAGGLYYGETKIQDAIKTDKAYTSITSNGKLVLDGTIKNSINNDVADTTGTLNIIANNELDINKQNKYGLDIDSILAAGNVNITSSGTTNILGNITDTGSLNITKNGVGEALISGVITDKTGNIKITNNGNEKFAIIKDAQIIAENGNISVINNGTNTEISGTVLNKNGVIEIENRTGLLTLANSSNITNNKGDIKIINDKELEFAGTVLNNDGKIVITNNSSDGFTFANGSVVENVKGDTIVTNNTGDLTIEDGAIIKNTQNGNISVENKASKFSIAGLIQHLGKGNVTVENNGNKELDVTTTGRIAAAQGDIKVLNSNTGSLKVNGSIENLNGKTSVSNSSADGIMISTTGIVHNSNGDVEISNTGSTGIDIQGSVKTDKQNVVITNTNSDLRIGEYNSDNDNYINAENGNIIITQTNGNILNNITDTNTNKKHQNSDLAQPDKAYKTLLSAGGDLIMEVTDGNIGSTLNSNPGYTIDAKTRDYTESINVKVNGNVIAKATNNNNTDKRLVNIRAKDSDINIKDITSDGNVILTAVDWKHADVKPSPENEEYFEGYSVFNTANGDDAAITGQNISVIASNHIGDTDKKLIYNQDTLNAPNSSVSFESENDLNVTARANSANETKIYQIISKRGNIDFDLESNAVIKEISTNKGLNITQKAQNLTIIDLGMPISSLGASTPFEDILKPHDNLTYGIDPVTPTNSVIPNYVNIRVLDAMDTPERADSYLRIYNATVAGNNGEKAQYYPNGTKIADVTLMADNIYANSAKAPDSIVSTTANPNGYEQTGKTYTDADFGGTGDTIYEANGINAYGEGESLTIDILGVNHDIVNDFVTHPHRTQYNADNSVGATPTKFQNTNKENSYYKDSFNAKNAVISVNDYSDTNRGVVLNNIYADNAYINTKDTNLSVKNGNIKNYGEFRNNDKMAVVDNDFRRIVKPADIQLYTQKTGSFALSLNDTINMATTAPTVNKGSSMLVNGYHSSWDFINREQKENKDQLENIKMVNNIDKNKYNEPVKRINERFDTTKDSGLSSDFEIYDISTSGALVKNNKKLKCGKNTTITLKFDDVDIKVNTKVVNTFGDMAGLKFIDLPKDVANKILFRYMQQADSQKSNLTTYND